MGNMNLKAWIVLICFLVAFLAGSGITEGARDLGMTGEVYNPQNFLGGILGPGPFGVGWGGGWPFRGWGGWGGGLCCGGGGIPGWGWGLHKPELAGPNDEAGGGAGYGKFPAYYEGAIGQIP